MAKVPVYRVKTSDGNIYENVTLREMLEFEDLNKIDVWPMGWQEREDEDE